MHIVVFHQYHHNPDCAATGRYYTFMERWAERHEVTLVTTDAWVGKRITHRFPWVPPGVRLVELHVPYDNTMGLRGRLGAFARYAAGAVLRGVVLRQPDVIFGTSTPLTAAWAAAEVARLRRRPWVFEVRDLWPDFPVQMGAVRQPWLQRALYRLERSLYRSAAHVIGLSPDMTRHIRRFRPQGVTTSFNGTDLPYMEASPADVAALRAEHGITEPHVMLYAGMFGRANNIPLVLETAERLRHRHDVRLVLLGDGFARDAVDEAARRLPQLTVLPPQPRHRMGAWYRLADLSLVPFLDLPVLAANSPAKLYDSLGAGTPVVVTNPGWTKAFVEAQACGWYVPPRAELVAAELQRLLATPEEMSEAGRRGAAIARERFDRRHLADHVEAILVDAARRPRS